MALAQMPQGQPPMQQQNNPQMRLMEIQQRLMAAQEQAFEANPQLQEQQEALEDLMIEKMQAQGFDPEARMATLDSLREQSQTPDLSEDQRQQMMVRAREAQQALQEGQAAVMQDSTVVAAQQALQQDVMTAMREQEPELDSLLDEFQALRMQMQMRQGQGMPPAQPPSEGPGGGR